jgi:hypothetical protein
MKRIDLAVRVHDVKIGDKCPYIDPNICEDSVFYLDGKAVGFYIQSVEGKIKQYLEIANQEFLSNRVPKSKMGRTNGVSQYSTIIGSVPPRPHMLRPYGSICSVHGVKSAQTFIKSMILACREGEQIIKDIIPEQHNIQKNIFSEVKDKWKLSELYTSSISNFNISAQYHRDTGNFQNTVNIILTKRLNSKGGCLNVPDFGATIEQKDNSMLVYPAWMSVHGVTPIQPTHEGGYRNSFIFYPLKVFKNL